MEVYYKNETLFVDVINDITLDTIALMERRIFKIIDDYGVDKIIISVYGCSNKNLLTSFKKKYYHRYKGYLWIK